MNTNWEEAKQEVDKMNFPNDRNFKEERDNSFHTDKKENHNLKTYRKWFQVLNYEAEAKYNTCPTCKEVRNQVIRIFDNEAGMVYERWFKFHGKDVEGKDITKVAKDIFDSD